MSYSIYYDRAFVRVDDQFIPMVNSGSNNCFEIRGNLQIPEKDWSVLNWKRRGRVMFSPDEIREIAREYDQYNQESGMIHKSRYRQFEPGEFERWVINGMKRAHTVEEYRSFGNGLYVLDYSPSETSEWRKHSFSTTAELKEILSSLSAVQEIDITLSDNREVYRPVNQRSRGHSLRASDLESYYVLAGEGISRSIQGQTIYFVKMTRRGFQHISDRNSSAVKVFRTEREAIRYVGRYKDRLKPFAIFKPVLVKAPQNRGATA